MAIPAALVVIPVGVIFLVSGLIVNLIQVMQNSIRHQCLLHGRDEAKDEDTLNTGFKRLEDFPMKFWLALFVEGTRFTQEKLEAAQDYASIRSLPSPRNVLIPRTKGFVSAVSHMRSFVPAVYDGTLTIRNNQPTPTLLRMFSGQSSELNLHMRRHKMSELPETDDGIVQWCQDLFITKAQMETPTDQTETILEKDNTWFLGWSSKLQDTCCIQRARCCTQECEMSITSSRSSRTYHKQSLFCCITS